MAVNLVLRALGLGDLLTGVPALRAMRRAWPDDWLMLAAPKVLQPLVRLTGAVDELIPTAGLCQFVADLHRYDVEQLRNRRPARTLTFGDEVPGLRPVHAVNLHGSGPDSMDCLRVLKPEVLISHGHPDRPEIRGPAWDSELHEIDRWCRMLEAYGIDTDRGDLRISPPAEPSPYPGAVVVHPGAAYRARRWPATRYAEVVRSLVRDGHQVVLTGGSSERALCVRVAEGAGLPESAVLAGRTDLAELTTVVAEAALVICGDTGTAHLATALGTPSVLLFGPMPPSRWGPTIDLDRHRVLWAGHIGDPHGDRPDPGLLALQVDDVIENAHRLLRRG